MKTKLRIIALTVIISIIIFPIFSLAITEMDNGIMKVYIPSSSFEYSWLKAFDVKGYITTDETTGETALISSTFGNYGYHTFLNVNGANGEMEGQISYDSKSELGEQIESMQYTEYDSDDGWQTINGINIRVTTEFINNGEQLQIIYTLYNTTSSSATISLGTVADVQIDGDDSATIQRLEDGTGLQLWTEDGNTDLPVQFVLYAKDVDGATDVDNIWIGTYSFSAAHISNVFNDNSATEKIENRDSAMAYSWTNRTIDAGETQTYSVLLEVGEINVPNTALTLDNDTEFYYTDVVINGSVLDEDLKDTITIHYTVDGTEYTLDSMKTTGTSQDFSIDLTSLNLSAGTDHTLTVWAVDSLGFESNVEERVFTVTYLKNSTLNISEEDWTSDDVIFSITDEVNVAQYVDTYQYRLNNGEWVDCDKDTNYTISDAGITQIDIRIVGTESGDYSDVITGYAKIDNVAPTTTTPTATSTTCNITVTSKQTDSESGIDTTETLYAIKIGDEWSDWQSSNIFTGLTHNTEYVVKTKSTDNVGNTSESEELTISTKELLLGNLILKLNSSEGNDYTENTWTNQNIYVAIEENVSGATTTYQSTSNSAETISATNQETTVTTNGITTLTLTVTDGTNTITSDTEHILKIDKVAPVITTLSLDDDEWTTSEKNITGKAIDELSGIVAYQFTTSSNITATSSGWTSIETTTSEITETSSVSTSGNIYFYVLDDAGNIGSVYIDTKIDDLGPIISFAKGDGETLINATDTGSGVDTIQYAWMTSETEPSDSEWSTYGSAVTYSGNSTGKIYLYAKATDYAGNETISYTTYSSLNAPTITSDDEFINEYITFTISGDNDEDVIYQFKIDDGEWQTISKDSTYTITNITDGTVTISARVLDNAGRYSTITTKKVTVSIADTSSDDSNSNSTDDDSGTTSSSSSSSSVANAGSSDSTTASGTLPQTGVSYILAGIITISLIGISVIMYRKYNLYKDIK